MKISGSNECLSNLNIHKKESGICLGSNDVLEGITQHSIAWTSSIFGTSTRKVTHKPKLYLHIPKNAWTVFTGKLREYCLPWRWKVFYLDKEDGSAPKKILVCNSIFLKNDLSRSLTKIAGKSSFSLNLINEHRYEEHFGKEFLSTPITNQTWTKIVHPLGEFMGKTILSSSLSYQHIFRPRSLYSSLMYPLLKCFSSSWKEQEITAGKITEKVLVNQTQEKSYSTLSLSLKN